MSVGAALLRPVPAQMAFCSANFSPQRTRATLAGSPRSPSVARAKLRCAAAPAHEALGSREEGAAPASKLACALRALSGAALSAVLVLAASPVLALPPPSASPQERLLAEVHSLTTDTFYNPEALSVEWRASLETATLHLRSGATAEEELTSMLSTLHDPWTRFVAERDFISFQQQNDGAIQGVGLLLSTSEAGRLTVVLPLADSPAERADIESGDEILSINGQNLGPKVDQERAASLLRGQPGSKVLLRVRHSDTVPGIPSKPPFTRVRAVRLSREVIPVSPVRSAVLRSVTPDGEMHTCGYVHLAAFTDHAGADVERALALLRSQGAETFILDLRGNGGGLVRAGLEVARPFLSGGDGIVTTYDRTGAESLIGLAPGASPAMVSGPLAVLIDGETASASEIVAAALHDNHRAVLLGSRSYGKGKIQTVYPFENGGALFVTVAEYRSPLGTVIDKVGIAPDVHCDVPPSSAGDLLQLDPCVVEAELRLSSPQASDA